MSNANGMHSPEVLISNLSLPPRLMLAGSLGAHERYIEAIGADGIEMTPMRSRFMRRMLFRATMIKRSLDEVSSPQDRDVLYTQIGYDIGRGWTDEDEAYENLVRSQHSSFRSETGDRTIAARIFPTWRESLEQMQRVQYITDDLPAVLYPGFEDGRVVYDNTNAPFADRTFQPTVEDWQRLGLHEESSAEDIRGAIGRRGFTGLTIDVFHLLRSYEGKKFKHPVEFSTRLARDGLVRAVHLSLNRQDSVGSDLELAASTRHAYEAFRSSAEKAKPTLEGQILSSIAKVWREQGAPGTRVVLEEDPRHLFDIKRSQVAIIENTRTVLADS